MLLIALRHWALKRQRHKRYSRNGASAQIVRTVDLPRGIQCFLWTMSLNYYARRFISEFARYELCATMSETPVRIGVLHNGYHQVVWLDVGPLA